MYKSSVPDWLIGVWRRLSIEENGKRDTTSQVFWLQTTSAFGDIRIPGSSPTAQALVPSITALTPQQALILAKQDGFAGITRLEGDRCEWHHAMDYQPFSGKADIGTLHWEGDILIEIGLNGAYKEEWQRIATGPTATLTLSDGSAWKGWLVICGDYFIYMRDYRTLLPAVSTLGALLNDQASDQQQANQSISEKITASAGDTVFSKAGLNYSKYLNCEISFGRCQKGENPWQIELSTLPWKVGNSLWSLENIAVDLQNKQVVQTVDEQTFIWEIQEWGELNQLLPPMVSNSKL